MLIKQALELLLALIRSMADLKIDKKERDKLRGQALDIVQAIEKLLEDGRKPEEPLPDELETAVTAVQQRVNGVAITSESAESGKKKGRIRQRIGEFFKGVGRRISGFFSGTLPRLAAIGVGGAIVMVALLVVVAGLGFAAIKNIGRPWHGTFSSAVTATGSFLGFTRGMGPVAESVFVTNAMAQLTMATASQSHQHRMDTLAHWLQRLREQNRHGEDSAWIAALATTPVINMKIRNRDADGYLAVVNGVQIPAGQDRLVACPGGQLRVEWPDGVEYGLVDPRERHYNIYRRRKL